MKHLLHAKLGASGGRKPPLRERTYVIEKADPGGDGDLLQVARAGLAVEVDCDLDLGLSGVALYCCGPRCHLVV